MTTQTSMKRYTRTGTGQLEGGFEKPVVVPQADDNDPASHAWADARFATDTMAEHGLFFALLMPPELAPVERAQAVEFSEAFARLHFEIDASLPPERSDLAAFTGRVVEQIKPFIEYKARLGEAQENGSLRSLVWPLFFEHTRHEAERWTRRLEACGRGEPEFERSEVATFWTNIMDEHARFVAHLLDPEEFDLIDRCMKTSKVFAELGSGGISGAIKATLHEPVTVVGSLIENPETDAVLSAAQTMLDFKTQTARDIEGARIKSIIDPRLADHVRREALKFVDELKRAV